MALRSRRKKQKQNHMGGEGDMDLGGVVDEGNMIKTHHKMLKEVAGKHTRSSHLYVCIDTLFMSNKHGFQSHRLFKSTRV